MQSLWEGDGWKTGANEVIPAERVTIRFETKRWPQSKDIFYIVDEPDF